MLPIVTLWPKQCKRTVSNLDLNIHGLGGGNSNLVTLISFVNLLSFNDQKNVFQKIILILFV